MVIEKYTKELREISKVELLTIMFNLMQSGHFSFVELSKVYVDVLEQKDADNRDLVCELGISLTMYKDGITGGTWAQAEQKANKALIRTGLFRGTGYEKKLIEKTNG